MYFELVTDSTWEVGDTFKVNDLDVVFTVTQVGSNGNMLDVSYNEADGTAVEEYDDNNGFNNGTVVQVVN